MKYLPAQSRPVGSALPSLNRFFAVFSSSSSTVETILTSDGVLLTPSHVSIARLLPTEITNWSFFPSIGMTSETLSPSVEK